MSEEFCPRFRADLKVRRLVESGEVGYTVYDPLGDMYYRLPAMVGDVCSLLDGQRTTDELSEEMGRRYPQYVFTQEYLDEVVEDLRKANLLEDAFNRNLLLLERAKEARQGLLRPEAWRNILNVQLGFFDPLPLFDRVHRFVRVIFTRGWFVGTVIAFLTALALIWDRREVLVHNFFGMFTLENSTWLGLLILYAVLFATIFAHEVGHGLCCYHYGGKPRRVGFLLLYFMPGMFCDTSDIYFFEKRWPRIAVALAGSYIEIQAFTLAAFIWAFTPPDLLAHDIAYRVMLFAGITGLLFNMNPLIKLDGYYVLMSWLDIPDLREKSFAYLRARALAIFTRNTSQVPRTTRRERRIFLTYGLLAMAYSTSFLWLSLLFLHAVFVKAFREVGVLLFLLFFFNATKSIWKKIFRGARLFALEHAGSMRRKAALLVGGLSLAVVVLLVPLPHALKVEAVLSPLDARAARSAVEGWIDDALVPEGTLVREGTVLALIASPDQEAERQTDRAAQAGAAIEERRRSLVDREARPARVRQASARLAGSQREGRAAWLVSPTGGRLLTPRPSSLVGRHVSPGDSVFVVGRTDSLSVILQVSERDVGDLAVGRGATLRLRAVPARTLRLRIDAVDLVAEGPVSTGASAAALADPDSPPSRYFARGRIANAGGDLRPGMSGLVRVQAAPLSLAQRLGRLYARLIRADFWF